MRREQFEHVIAAAADVSGEREIVVIGSQAILGNFPEPPETMLFSIEVDVYPLNNPDKADEIDGNLGDGSPFHGTHGYYAHGVGPETAVAPVGSGRTASSGSRFPRESGNRLKSSPSAWRFTILILAKCVAGRDRDREFARDALAAGLVQAEELLRRSEDLPEPPANRANVRRLLGGIVARLERR